MPTSTPGSCELCGRAGVVHVTEIRDGVKTSRSFCPEHAPPELRDKLPFGAHCTPAEEAAFLREKLNTIEQLVPDPAKRAAVQAEIEQLIADIQAGRRRLGDAE